MYLLDTNHCTRLLQGEHDIHRHISVLTGTPVATRVIVSGELLYMAYRSDRVAENLAEVESFLQGIPIYTIDSAIAHAYGELRASLFRRFDPKARAKQRHTTIAQLGFDDNDLWIAAIALRHALTVVTSDNDFARIADVSDLRHESWLAAKR